MTEKKRGFAAMDPERQRAIAAEGGRAAHRKGTAHEFTREEARSAGRLGGEAISEDREHMSEIGKKGGLSVSSDREHMRAIGRRGGEAVVKLFGSEHMAKIAQRRNNEPA